MTIPKIVTAQRDFSAGAIDPTAKRADDIPAVKAGGRQMTNWRILESKAITNRQGRAAQFLVAANARIEEFDLAPGSTFKIVFAPGILQIYSAANAVLFSQTGFPWGNAADVAKIVWAVNGRVIYIAFPSALSPTTPPYTLTWNGVTTFTFSNFAEQLNGNQKRTWFYRISPQGVTMQPSDVTGVIFVDFSAPIMTAAHIGTRVRFLGRQIQLTGIVSATRMGGVVQETLPYGFRMNMASNPQLVFAVGDVITGLTTGATAIITSMDPSAINCQLIPGPRGGIGFQPGEGIAGPSGAANILPGGGNVATIFPQPVTVWDDEVMNSLRGYPQSVFVDQGRLGFCNFPALPNAIGWSAINSPNDLYIDGTATGGMLELAPDKSQVYFVTPGTESNEFVFTDKKVYYIPISVTNPLKAGSVAFQTISGDGAAQVQPRFARESIVYVNAGQTRLMTLATIGAYQRPFEAREISELHNHLFATPKVIAAPSADASFPERYIYVVNTNGTVVVGKYQLENGQIKGTVSFLPWNGVGSVSWMAAYQNRVQFSTSYPGVLGGVNVAELLDVTQYLDAGLFVNAIPTPLTPPVGKGPLWWLPNGSVELIDQGTRMMGTYQIDANGNIIPQNNGGENLLSATLVAGQMWTATFEPFIPLPAPGQNVGQRMKKRRVAEMAAAVKDSTGFYMARLFSGPLTPNGPALGTVVNIRRFPAWNQGDNPLNPPPLREEVESWRPLGRATDPRVAIVKDTPGPLTILELNTEVTV